MGGTYREVNPLQEIGEPLKEMVSALVDGEASDFEARRVLEQAGDPAVRALLARHYAVRSVLRRDAPLICPPSLTRSVLDAIEREPLPVSDRPSRWQGWARGAAVAASVCAVAVLGTHALLRQQDSGAVQFASSGAVIDPLGQPAIAPAPGNQGLVAVGLRPPIANDAHGVARERLRMYMLEQAGNSALNTPEGMMPYARVVSYEEP